MSIVCAEANQFANGWLVGNPAALIAALRPGGWVLGRSKYFLRDLRLHKTDLIADLRREPQDAAFYWRINGDANATGRYAKDRRTVVVWLGKH